LPPIKNHIYARLVAERPGYLAPAEFKELDPELAESWEWSPDRLQLTLKLRQNVKRAYHAGLAMGAHAELRNHYSGQFGLHDGQGVHFNHYNAVRAREASVARAPGPSPLLHSAPA